MTTYEHMLQAHWAAGLAKLATTDETRALATHIARTHARQAAEHDGVTRIPRG